MHELTLKENGAEILEYDHADFPVRARSGSLGIFANYAAACHWHRDFEVLRAIGGEMDCFVNGERIHLTSGQAVFVNSGRLHYGYSEAGKDCDYRFVVYHPMLLGTHTPIGVIIERLIARSNRDWWLLDENTPEGARALECMENIYQASLEDDALSALSYSAMLTQIIYKMSNASDLDVQDSDWDIIRRMVGFIQTHYSEAVSLAEIAAAGAVCRSRCCSLFRDKLGTTVGQFVMQYRLDKACGLMMQGKPITETAMECGFNSSSYFAEAFKKTYGMTPRAYKSSRGL